MPCISFKSIYSPGSPPCAVASSWQPSLEMVRRSSFRCWQLPPLLFLLDIDISSVVTNPRLVHYPLWSPFIKPPLNYTNFGMPPFSSWDPDTTPKIMKEYESFLVWSESFVRAIWERERERETERKRDIPLMDHPTCDRHTTYWPSGTHCLGMAWSAAVGSLTSLFPSRII